MKQAEAQSLPSNTEAERLILGSVLLDCTNFPALVGSLAAGDFSIEKHRRIFGRMVEIYERGEKIDRVTVAEELAKNSELESCDGISYLCSLDDGLPRMPNVDNYLRIVRDKSILRQMIFAGQGFINRCFLEDEKPEAIWAKSQSEMLDIASRRGDSSFLSPTQIIEREGGMERYLDRRSKKRGLSTGFLGVDRLIGGLEPGKLYVIGARPRVGKTAFALNIAEHVSRTYEGTTLIFSMEMGDISLLDRLISSRARVNLRRFTSGYMGDDERRAIGRAAGEMAGEDRILIDHKAMTDMAEVHAKIRSEKARRDVVLVIFDYLQLMLSGDDRHRVAEMSRISRNCKVVLKDCGVPGIALSQLSRGVDERNDHRPMLSDLRESGAIEQDADLVAFLFRQDVYRRSDEPKDHLADFIVAKQRDGPEGIIPMEFAGEIVRFTERSNGPREDE